MPLKGDGTSRRRNLLGGGLSLEASHWRGQRSTCLLHSFCFKLSGVSTFASLCAPCQCHLSQRSLSHCHHRLLHQEANWLLPGISQSMRWNQSSFQVFSTPRYFTTVKGSSKQGPRSQAPGALKIYLWHEESLGKWGEAQREWEKEWSKWLLCPHFWLTFVWETQKHLELEAEQYELLKYTQNAHGGKLYTKQENKSQTWNLPHWSSVSPDTPRGNSPLHVLHSSRTNLAGAMRGWRNHIHT